MGSPLHDDLIRTLELSVDAAPSGILEAWLAVARDPGSLWRGGDPEHFTASALPVADDGARVCLVHHRRMGLWVQPGGHFEESDISVPGAALREMTEETGLVGDIAPAPVNLSSHRAPCRPGAWHLDLQFVVRAGFEPVAVSEESNDVAWFDVNGLPADMAPGVEDLVMKARRSLSRSGSRATPSSEA